MKAYTLRRLLLMIPTFFGISLILFVILNLAPGRPGAEQSGDLSQSMRGEVTAESYKIFREQFHLDKPILFNTRFTLTREEVRARLAAAAGVGTTSAAERVEAQETLEDLGGSAVPYLVGLLDDPNPKLRDAATYFLRIDAVRPLEDPFNPRPSPSLRAKNRAIDEENAELRTLRYAPEDAEATKIAVIGRWKTWFAAHRTRFQRDALGKVSMFFFDTRFAAYWRNLLRLDFGVSLISREPVVATLVSKLKYSLTLSVGSLLLAYLVAIPLGVFSAVKKGSRADRAVTLVLFMLYSLPNFFVATILLYFLSSGSEWESLRWFPTGGWSSTDADELTTLGQWRDIAWHLVLPMICMTYGSLAALSRYMRSGLLEVIQADYVRTARAKGLSERVVIGKHALRNGLLPILTLLAGLFPAILGGSVIIEYIFGIQGLGLWVVEAINQRDYNVILAVELFTTVLVLVGLLLTDLSYALVDPRIRYE
ncbi:MAG TPA: ABC transporter permease [Polyangiaceae bacterium]|nr:ABC transporter permease [Polyangiaceae bacterium]